MFSFRIKKYLSRALSLNMEKATYCKCVQRWPVQFAYIHLSNTGIGKNRSIQSNLDGSNTDGSFTMANSNSFLSPTKFFR